MRKGGADAAEGHTGGVPAEGLWSGRDRDTSLPPPRTPRGCRGGRQVCNAVAEQGWCLEGHPRNQLQPQPRPAGQVAADGARTPLPIYDAREKHCWRNVESFAQLLDVGFVEVTFPEAGGARLTRWDGLGCRSNPRRPTRRSPRAE